MVIYLPDLTWFDDDDSSHFEILDILLRASASGRHFLVLSRESGRQLRKYDDFSVKAKGELKRVISDTAFRLGFLDHCRPIMRLTDQHNQIAFDAVDGIYDVHFSRFLNLDELGPTKLLLEDEEDGNLYHAAIINNLEKVIGNGIKAAVSIEHGGGSSISRRFKTLFRSQPIGLIVMLVDSDKNCPNCRIGNTAANAMQTFEDEISREYKVAEFLAVEAHEVENFLPTSAAQFLTGRFKERYDRVQSRLVEQSLQGCEFWRYLDLKKGLSLRMYFNMPSCCRTYWRNASQTTGARLFNGCLQRGRCGRGARQYCSCVIFEPLEGVQQAVNARLPDQDASYLAAVLDDDSIEERRQRLANQMEQIQNFFIASNVMRA